jgi:Zn-finger nucleic acid-binding protein
MGHEESGKRTMICPSCGAEMQTVVREGIEIERCASCRGVFLDRGELEKLIALGADDDRPHYEQSVDEEGEEPDAGDKLATRRSFFAGLFDPE